MNQNNTKYENIFKKSINYDYTDIEIYNIEDNEDNEDNEDYKITILLEKKHLIQI